MSPTLFLIFTIALTFAAASVWSVVRGRHQRRLQQLAAEWRMHYSAGDRFRLADRVAEKLPIPGAASVSIVDLIYGNEHDRYRYVFGAEYTRGVLRSKKRVRCVATFTEPKDGTGGAAWSPLVVAPLELPLVEQYRHLREREFPNDRGVA